MADPVDKEVEAISAVLKALESLDDEAQDRVLDYAFKRLGRSVVRRAFRASLGEGQTQPSMGTTDTQRRSPSSGPADIRSLKEEKKPKSANEMAALVAYYLSDMAPAEEQAAIIGPTDIERYFKQARFPLPKATRNTLSNAAAAGYFDSVGHGRYRLNPVGYNLVVHGMPTEAGSKDAQGSTRTRSSSRKKTTRKRTRRRKTSQGKTTRRR